MISKNNTKAKPQRPKRGRAVFNYKRAAYLNAIADKAPTLPAKGATLTLALRFNITSGNLKKIAEGSAKEGRSLSNALQRIIEADRQASQGNAAAVSRLMAETRQRAIDRRARRQRKADILDNERPKPRKKTAAEKAAAKNIRAGKPENRRQIKVYLTAANLSQIKGEKEEAERSGGTISRRTGRKVKATENTAANEILRRYASLYKLAAKWADNLRPEQVSRYATKRKPPKRGPRLSGHEKRPKDLQQEQPKV